MGKKENAEILWLCAEVIAADGADREITIMGCGCNSFEVSPMADRILEILRVNRTSLRLIIKDIDDWYDGNLDKYPKDRWIEDLKDVVE